MCIFQIKLKEHCRKLNHSVFRIELNIVIDIVIDKKPV